MTHLQRIGRRTIALLFALTACGGGPVTTVDRQAAETEYIGGWDASKTTGTSVLLLREGLTGRLSSASLQSDEAEYQLSFDVNGELMEDIDALNLELSCAEVRTRVTVRETEDDHVVEPPAWTGLDCAGWELALHCSLAGTCGSGGCNMICDIVHFGDAYAHAQVPLHEVEDQFDFWERV
jgi:hypothetical protein